MLISQKDTTEMYNFDIFQYEEVILHKRLQKFC